MTLAAADNLADYTICGLTGGDRQAELLASFGLVEGTKLRVLSNYRNNRIIRVRGARIAVSHELSQQILVR